MPENLGRTMSVTDFSLDAVQLVEDIATSGREILLTREGRVVARVIPAEYAAVGRVSPIDDWGNDE